MMQKLKDMWLVLRNRECWTQVHNYCPVWDEKLKLLMELHEFKLCYKQVAELGGTRIWIANHPYGSFTVPGPEANGEMSAVNMCRPSRATILRAWIKLRKDTGMDKVKPHDH